VSFRGIPIKSHRRQLKVREIIAVCPENIRFLCMQKQQKGIFNEDKQPQK